MRQKLVQKLVDKQINKQRNTRFKSIRKALAATVEHLEGRVLFSAGQLDPSFGSAGRALSNLGFSSAFAMSMTIEADGKLLVAGEAGNGGSYDFAVARFNANGTLDPTFGTGGVVTTDFGSAQDMASAIAVQADGKIVVAGQTVTPGNTYNFAVARYNANGSLDGSFGAAGKVITNFGGKIDLARALLVQSNGSLLVCGQAGSQMAAVRYLSSGALDGSFGSGGEVIVPFAGATSEATAMAMQGDGKIVLGGFEISNNTLSDFAAARLNADGSVDASFGSGGHVSADMGGNADQAFGVTVQSSGGIVLAGMESDTNSDISRVALLRYTSTGVLDGSFGSAGKSIVILPSDPTMVDALTAQPDGKLLVAGATASNAGGGAFVARLSVDGILDGSFATAGVASDPSDPNHDYAIAVAMGNDGKIYIAGTAVDGDWNGQFIVERFDGDPIPAPLSTSIAMQADPVDSSKTALVINGTAGNDKIFCLRDAKTGGVKVYMNGANCGTYNPTGRIIINAGEGNDYVRVGHLITLPAEIYGGAGNDTLIGGGGNALILGGDGNDRLWGRGGNNLLIGGAGRDRLGGGDGSNLEVGGSTTYDNDPASLRSLLAEWSRKDITFARRSFDIMHGGGLNGAVQLDATTITGNPTDDMLCGGRSNLLLFPKVKGKNVFAK